MRPAIISILLFIPLLFSAAALADDQPTCAEQLSLKEEALQALSRENAELREKLSQPQLPVIGAGDLQSRMIARLREIAANVRVQRQTMNDFQGYVTWMSGNVAGYSRYIQAGSVAAGFARVLPIPYAGQAGMFTKFVSHFTLSLSAASKSITSFMSTSQQFISQVEGLEKNPAVGSRELADLSRFADEQLLRDMTEVQEKLATTAELSASALSFLESLNHYVGSSDEYWAKAKSLMKKGDADKKEKSYLSESITSLKNKAESFNGKLKAFDDTVRKDTPLIKGLTAYDELLKEMSGPKIASGPPQQPVHAAAPR